MNLKLILLSVYFIASQGVPAFADDSSGVVSGNGPTHKFVCEPNYKAIRASAKKDIAQLIHDLKKVSLRSAEDRGWGLFVILDRVSRATFFELEKNVHLEVSYDEREPNGHYRYSKEGYVDAGTKPDYSEILLELPIIKKISKDVTCDGNKCVGLVKHVQEAVDGQLTKEFLEYVKKNGIKPTAGTIEGNPETVLASRGDFERRDAWGTNAAKWMRMAMETEYGTLSLGQDLDKSGFNNYYMKCTEQE